MKEVDFLYLRENSTYYIRNDISEILEKNNVEPICDLKFIDIKMNKIKKMFLLTKFTLSLFKNPPLKTCVFFMMPLRHTYKILQQYAKKGGTLVAIVIDLMGIHDRNEKVFKTELEILKKCHRVIVHNDKMESLLISYGIEAEKILKNYIWDYLEEKTSTVEKKVRPYHYNICYAGNLRKADFLYKLTPEILSLNISVFGEGFRSDNGFNALAYYGYANSTDIYKKLNGKFGLVWVGNSIKSCTGTSGEYLKTTTPLKLSLYVMAEIPIIIWKQAEAAKFVLEQNIGVAVDSLLELPQVIEECDDAHYEIMKSNLIKLKSEIKKGNILGNLIRNICLEISLNNEK